MAVGNLESVVRVRADAAHPILRRAALTLLAAAFAAAFFVMNALMRGRAAPSLETPLDRAIPFWPPAVVAYGLVYLFLFIPVLQIRDLRLFARAVYAFCAYNLVALAVFLLVPTRYPRPESLPVDSFFSWCVGLVYAADPGYNNFPSLHVANATFIALLARRVDRRVGAIVLALAAAIAGSTVLVKQHWIADVIAGAALGGAAYRIGVARGAAAEAERQDLAFPRRFLLALAAAYGLGVGALAIARAAGGEAPK